jgi:hypothetical protein
MRLVFSQYRVFNCGYILSISVFPESKQCWKISCFDRGYERTIGQLNIVFVSL